LGRRRGRLAGVTDPQPTDTGRPLDVDTGFWLWVAALPLMVIGYVVDLVATESHSPMIVYAVSVVFVIVLAAVVLTFLILMRHGYRWARTLLTGGGVASVVYAATNLFTVARPPVAAVAYAVTAIVGSVLIAGGVFLLHRKDAHAFFTR
jgi:glucose-6-phosphate-specific signal transduction histidine kinase